MDYSKLAGVANQLSGKTAAVIADTLKLSDDKNPLDSLETTPQKRVADSKVLIFDDVAVEALMTAPRDKRRSVLSRLSDSQRTRILKQWEGIKSRKIKDDEFEDDYEVFSFDLLLTNYVYNSTDYLKEKVEDLLHTKNFEGNVKRFAENLLNSDSFDAVDSRLLANYESYLESLGLHTNICTALEIATKEVVDEPLFSDTEDLTDETISEIENAAEEDFADSISKSDFSSLLSKVDDSISKFVVKGYNYNKVSKCYNTKLSTLLTSKVNDSSFKDKYGVTPEQVLSKKVMDDTLKAFDELEQKPFIDEHGNEVSETEDKSIISLLNEALESYAEGDSTKLDSLLQQTVSEDTELEMDESEDNSDEKSDDSEEVNLEVTDSIQEWQEDSYERLVSSVTTLFARVRALQGEGFTDSALSDVQDVLVDLGTEVSGLLYDNKQNDPFARASDAVKLAYSIKNGKPNQKLVDSLKKYVPALSKYNFVITDCTIGTSPVNPPQAPVAEPPMTRDEYYSLSQPLVPCYFDNLVQQCSIAKCPTVSQWESIPEESCIRINGNLKYMPYKVSLTEFENLMNSTPKENWNKIVDLNCCPLEDALRLASLTNNLQLVDNKFYKKHLSDSKWYFDEVPSCLPSDTTCHSVTMAVTDSDSKVSIFGTDYVFS